MLVAVLHTLMYVRFGLPGEKETTVNRLRARGWVCLWPEHACSTCKCKLACPGSGPLKVYKGVPTAVPRYQAATEWLAVDPNPEDSNGPAAFSDYLSRWLLFFSLLPFV